MGALLAVLVAGWLHRVARLQDWVRWLLPVGIAQSVYAGYDTLHTPFFGSPLFSLSKLILAAAIVGVGVGAWQVLRSARGRQIARLWRIGSSGIAGGFVVALLVIGAGLYGLQQYREHYRLAVYARGFGEMAVGWSWIAAHGSGAKIAMAGMPLFYPLYGPSLDNEVRYVNIVGDLDDVYHDLFAKGLWYRAKTNSAVWLANLDHWGADYLVLQGDEKPQPERDWVKADPQRFKLVFQGSKIDIYQIVDEAP